MFLVPLISESSFHAAALSQNFGIHSSSQLILNGFVYRRWFIASCPIIMRRRSSGMGFPMLSFCPCGWKETVEYSKMWDNTLTFCGLAQEVFGLQNCEEYKISRFDSSLPDCNSLLEQDIGCNFDHHTIFFLIKKKRIRTLIFIILHLLNSHMIEMTEREKGYGWRIWGVPMSFSSFCPPNPQIFGEKRKNLGWDWNRLKGETDIWWEKYGKIVKK